MKKVKKLLTCLLATTVLFAAVEPAYVFADENVTLVEEETANGAENEALAEVESFAEADGLAEYEAIAEDEALTEGEALTEVGAFAEEGNPSAADEALLPDGDGTYSVILDANGGVFPEKASEAGEVSEDKKILTIKKDPAKKEIVFLPEDCYPTLEGKSLAGWSITPNAEVIYDPDINYNIGSDATLYAVWGEAVTVEFYAGEGTFPEEAAKEGTLDADKKILTVTSVPERYFSLPEEERPAKEGQIFAGWTSVKGGPVEYEAGHSIRVEGNDKWYAVYSDSCTVRLHAVGGTFPDDAGTRGKLSADKKTLTLKVPSGSNLLLQDYEIPQNGNKVLKGWASSANAKEPDQGVDPHLYVNVRKDSEYYAVWSGRFTVTFIATGSLYFKDNDKYVQKVDVSVPRNARLSNYAPLVYLKAVDKYENVMVNLGWSTKKNAKPENAFDDFSYCINKDVKLYPVLSNLKITFDANGGKILGENKMVQEYRYGASVDDLRDYPSTFGLVRENYRFIGWGEKKNTAPEDVLDFHNVHATRNKTYYAVWTKDTIKITIDGNGRTFNSADNAVISEDKTKITAYLEKGTSIGCISFSYVKDGKVYFNGDEGLSVSRTGDPIEDVTDYVPNKDTKLYVVGNAGEKGVVPIIYNANGGVFTDGQDRSMRKIEAGRTFTGPVREAKKKGYFLKGWYTKPTGGKELHEDEDTVNKQIEVYAHWTKGVTVTFDANGGTFATPGLEEYKTRYEEVMEKGSMLSSIYNGYYTIPYSLDNDKGFVGWSKKKDGKVIDLSTVKVNRSMRLYAVWGKGDNLADGRIDMTGKTYYYTGRQIKPKFTVYDRNGNKVSPSRYEVIYSDNITAGKGYLTVIGKGKKYTGMLRRSFDIKYNKTAKIKKADTDKKSITLRCSKAEGAGQYMFYAVDVTTGRAYVKLTKKTSATIKDLNAGKYLVYVHPIALGKDGVTVESEKAGNVEQVTVK